MKPPIRVCCGQRHCGPQCPDGKVVCCICFERVTMAQLNRTSDGQVEDVCQQCAIYESEREHQ